MCENHTENVVDACEKCAVIPPWKVRMVEEYRFIKDKYDKLHKMIVKYEAGTLEFEPDSPYDLLIQQLGAMEIYLHCLEARAEIEGVEL